MSQAGRKVERWSGVFFLFHSERFETKTKAKAGEEINGLVK